MTAKVIFSNVTVVQKDTTKLKVYVTLAQYRIVKYVTKISISVSNARMDMV